MGLGSDVIFRSWIWTKSNQNSVWYILAVKFGIMLRTIFVIFAITDQI